MKLFYVGAGPSPRLHVRSGDRPDHLAATAVVTAGYAKIAIRRRRACLGMPTDCGRRYFMWRCTTNHRAMA